MSERRWVLRLAALVAVATVVAAGSGCSAPEPSVLLLRRWGTAPDPTRSDGFASATVVALRGGWAYAVTCRHALVAATSVTVDGVDAQEIAEDPGADLALLRFAQLSPYRAARIAAAQLGEPATAVGYCRAGQVSGAITRLRHRQGGNVSWTEGLGVGTSCAFAPGFSGGALLNRRGELIGICQRILGTPWGALDDHGTAIRAERIRLLLVGIADTPSTPE